MTIDFLEQFGGYRGVNDGIHRKAADNVGHPAIVRHIGFWEEPRKVRDPNTGKELVDPSTGRTVVEIRPAEERASKIADYLKRLSQRLSAAASCHSDTVAPTLTVNPHERGQIIVFKFRWYGLATTMRFEVNTEFVTCTTLIDLSLRPVDKIKDGVEREGRTKLITALTELIAGFNSGAAIDFSSYHAEIYEKIWEKFQDDILDYHPFAPNDEYLCGDRLGSIFADFRGLILGDQYPPPSSDKPPPLDRCATEEQPPYQPPPIQAPFADRSPPRGRPHVNERQPERWARAVTRRAEQFVVLGLDHAELTVSRFLDGRIIYMSALGPQLDSRHSPVRYLMHSCTDDEWQIGRLVDRLHTLGTLRLASSIQINELSLFSYQLKNIEKEIEIIRLQIRAYISKDDAYKKLCGEKPKKSEKRKYEEDKRKQKEALEIDRNIISQRYADLTIQIRAMEEEFSGNAEDRVQQAKYYIEKFKTDCDSLRQRRLEGYQPYREFVLRRLGGTFSFIALMDERLATYSSNLALLHNSYITLNLSITSTGIKSLQIDVAEKDGLMEEIQDVGEIVLFCIIAPHYLFETAFRLLNGFKSPGKEIVDEIIQFREGGDYSEAFWLLIAIIVGSCFEITRITFAPHRKPNFAFLLN